LRPLGTPVPAARIERTGRSVGQTDPTPRSLDEPRPAAVVTDERDGAGRWGPTTRPVPQWTRPGAAPVQDLGRQGGH